MKRLLKSLRILSFVVVLIAMQNVSVSGLSEEQRRTLDSGVYFLDVDNVDVAVCRGNAILVGSDNPEKIYNFFIGQNFEPWQAAGIMGNMMSESGLNPRALEPNTTGDAPISGRGFGLVQWTFDDRQQPLIKLAEENKVPVTDLGIQLQYVMQELQQRSEFIPVYEKFLASTNVNDATDIIMEGYEIPGNLARQRPIRRIFANNFLTQFGSGTGTATSGNGCGVSVDGCPSGPADRSQMVTVQNIVVHPCISNEVDRIITLAREEGLDMSGGGYRSTQDQENTRIANGCRGRVYDKSCRGTPRTAIPGSSRHERGSAVDFTCDGTIFRSRTHECFIFLHNNTNLINFDDEPWHWSADGS